MSWENVIFAKSISEIYSKTYSRFYNFVITVVLRPPGIVQQNIENECKKVYVEFTRDIVSTHFYIITLPILPNLTILWSWICLVIEK
jgi:hypothetical protein